MKKLLYLFVGLWGMVGLPMANAQTITIAAEDTAVNVQGRWNESESTLNGFVQVTLKEGDGATLNLLTFDLVNQQAPTLKVTRDNIMLAEELVLSQGVPTNIKVLFQNIPAVGVYVGKVKLYADANLDQAIEIPIRLEAVLHSPERVSSTDSIRAQVIGSRWFNFFLPYSYRMREVSVTLFNDGNKEAVIKDYSFHIRGSKALQELDNDQFVLLQDTLPLTIPAFGRKTIYFSLENTGIAPDGYYGDLLLTFAENSEVAPLRIGVSMNARAGMLWVLVSLLAGIVLGKIIKDMSSEKAKAQVAYMDKLGTYRAELDAVKRTFNGKDFGLNKVYQNAQEAINQADSSDAPAVDEAIGRLAERLAVMRQLADMVEVLRESTTTPPADRVAQERVIVQLADNLAAGLVVADDTFSERLRLLQQVWNKKSFVQLLADEGKDDPVMLETIGFYKTKINILEAEVVNGADVTTAQLALDEIQTGLDTDVLNRTPTGGSRSVDANTTKVEPASPEPPSSSPTFWQRIRGALEMPIRYTFYLLMDMKEPNAQVRYWFFRPLLSFIVLGSAVLSGISEAYLSNPVFGSEGFGDYVGLIVWGIGSKITASTVGDFTESIANRSSSAEN